MTRTTIVCTCDICGKGMEHGNTNYLKWHFTVKDFLGNGCANGGQTYNDICDKRIEKLGKAIYETWETGNDTNI